MEWTDIFSGPAFEPVKSRELHLGKDCDLSRPLVVRDTDKLTVEVAGGAALRLVVLHTKPCQAELICLMSLKKESQTDFRCLQPAPVLSF